MSLLVFMASFLFHKQCVRMRRVKIDADIQ
jgi:hypothetical protein